MVRHAHERTQAPPFAFPHSTPLSNETFAASISHVADGPTRSSLWTQISTPTRTRRVSSIGQGSKSMVRQYTGHARSLSQSTIDARLGAGAFNGAIDQAASTREPARKQRTSLPTLEVPIPHYKLGTPRFSTRGTAFLHNSVYTRSSVNDDILSTILPGGEPDTLFPGMHSSSTRQSYASARPHSIPKRQPQEPESSSVSSQPVHHQVKEPILPDIYDSLAADPNDPSIVRYSPYTREIVAASPARLVAQITSENFLDYELLSDFFLTVRAYLSTQDLLSYLLARFEWAINRFDDHGRIIRVRAFAALRHWILNYFPYDFVLDRELRIQFCDQLNRLSKAVRARSSHGASDLKLISDLKKCWNGRCVLYWDNPLAVSDGHNDVDIRPGGVAGSRNSQLTHLSQLRPMNVSVESPQIISDEMNGTSASMMDKWYDDVLNSVPKNVQGHMRQVSATTTRSLPTSPISEQSMQAISCSFPAKGFKRMIRYPAAVHPVPVTPNGRRLGPVAPSAASNERPTKAGHKRSGSFSDAVRDHRAPLPSGRAGDSEEQRRIAYPYSGSLVRGHIIAPGTPDIYMLAPTTPSVELPNLSFSSQEEFDDIYDQKKPNGPTNPGVRHLLGSIRRVLSSKTSVTQQSCSIDGSALSVSSLKKLTLPTNVSSSGGLDSPSRIDLMALDVLEAFLKAASRGNKDETQGGNSVGLAPGNEQEQPLPEISPPSTDSRPQQPIRKQSEITNGSKSIMIFDDTGPNLRNMPELPDLPKFPYTPGNVLVGATPRPDSSSVAHSATLSLKTSPSHQYTQGMEKSEALPLDGLEHIVVLNQARAPKQLTESRQRSVGAAGGSVSNNGFLNNHESQEATLLNRTYSYTSTRSRSLSISLRRYASFQSTFTRHLPQRSLDDNVAAEAGHTLSTDTFEHSPARMLRRRPGGDLRAHQNVHDLEQMPRPRSAGSITTNTDSVGGSGLLITSEMIGRHASTRKSPQNHRLPQGDPASLGMKKAPSLVRTHSSQPALRPSFEAAVAEFARIPDDEEGGVEATLLKLEGKYQKSPLESTFPQLSLEYDNDSSQCQHGAHGEQMESSENQTSLHDSVVGGTIPVISYSGPNGVDLGGTKSTAIADEQIDDTGDSRRPMVPSTIYAGSEESYSSNPLPERTVSGRSKQDDKSFVSESKASMPQPLFSENYNNAFDHSKSPMISMDRIDLASGLRRLKRGSSVPTVTTDSFLLDEDEYLSDLSSEMSLEMGVRDNEFKYEYGQGSTVQAHPDTIALGINRHPPSPPMTMENALSISSQANRADERRKPPTPDPSPVSQHVQPTPSQTSKGEIGHAHPAPALPAPNLQASRHMCFILSFDSKIIAQQMTVLERDALNEVDWRDLVDMRWHNTSPSVTNWVQYLQTHDPRGIDLVTARFNLVVKWALSEIVLTQKLEERALTIMKYIHIAQHCRKAHNYATMLQFTIALTSIDCTRLTKTWELVPAPERRIIHELETLVTPRKNFHNLRMEMETANTEEGCIPVVGS